MKYLVLLLINISLFASTLSTQEQSENNSASVVKIFTHYISPNYEKPWNAGENSSATGSGVIMEGNLILTAAHVVTDATYIEIKKHGNPKKFFAHVKWIAHDADLALIEVKDQSFFDGTTAKKLGSTPRRQESVTVYGYPEGGNKISITQGIISRIEVTSYIHSFSKLLSIQIDAAINPGNSGGPAFNAAGEIVGIAIQSLSNSNNIGYIAPTAVIQHFFDDINDGKYDGFPEDGIVVQTMENQDLKDYYAMGDRTGVLVKGVIKGSSSDGYIYKEDIILEIDGIDVADNNTAFIDGLERVSSNYLVTQHQVGSILKIKVLRNKEVIEVEVPLKGETYAMTYNHNDNPRYYIFAGLVFMPMSLNYYYNMSSLPASFGYEYDRSQVVGTGSKKKEVVFISIMLEDKINAGYSVSYVIVKKVNGQDVDSFDDLVKKIEASTDKVKISLFDGEIIVLDKKKALQSESRILKRYGIKEASCLSKHRK